MNDLSPIYLDLLAKHGVLENAPQVHISPKPDTILSNPNGSAQQTQSTTAMDTFSRKNTDPLYNIKAYGSIGLLVYLAGVVCSKGKLNPLEGIKSLYNVLSSSVSKFCKIFKKP